MFVKVLTTCEAFLEDSKQFSVCTCDGLEYGKYLVFVKVLTTVEDF